MPSTESIHACIDSPVGCLQLRFNADASALTGLAFCDDEPHPKRSVPAAVRPHVAQLEAFFSNPQAELDLPIEEQGTAFQRRVWQALRELPRGRTASYGAVAAQLGSGPRAVAGACRANPIPIVTPCHRLVGADGSLTGYCGSAQESALSRKAWLIAHEAGA